MAGSITAGSCLFMFIPGNARRAFTLLEVMIAVLIIALITTSVYRFVLSTLAGIDASRAASAQRIALVRLVGMLEAELHDLSPRTNNAIVGIPHKFNNQPSDELEWLCRAGNGLFTGAAEGEWRVTLAVQPPAAGSGGLELGLRRRLAGAKASDYTWLPLIRPVAGLEIRYFDPRLNAWLERWTDGNARPLLVRVKIWRDAQEAPYETLITVPSANLQP